MSIGENIKSTLVENKMTQKELAKKLDVTENTVSFWIKDIKKPDIIHVINMSKLFNKSIDYILTGEEKEAESENHPNNIKELKSLTEQKIIEDYRSLDNEGKKQLENFFDYLKNKYIKK